MSVACIPGLKAFNEVAYRAHLESRDSSGDPRFGPKTVLRVRIEPVNKKIVTSDGNEVQVKTLVMSPDLIRISDRLWLPGDDTRDGCAGRRIVDLEATPSIDGKATIYEAML